MGVSLGRRISHNMGDMLTDIDRSSDALTWCIIARSLQSGKPLAQPLRLTGHSAGIYQTCCRDLRRTSAYLPTGHPLRQDRPTLVSVAISKQGSPPCMQASGCEVASFSWLRSTPCCSRHTIWSQDRSWAGVIDAPLADFDIAKGTRAVSQPVGLRRYT